MKYKQASLALQEPGYRAVKGRISHFVFWLVEAVEP